MRYLHLEYLDQSMTLGVGKNLDDMINNIINEFNVLSSNKPIALQDAETQIIYPLSLLVKDSSYFKSTSTYIPIFYEIASSFYLDDE